MAEAAWEGSVREAIKRVENECGELDVKINTGRARQRYLNHLAKSQDEGTKEEEDECCILCKCEFTKGYLTQWYVFESQGLLLNNPKFSSVHMFSVRYYSLQNFRCTTH